MALNIIGAISAAIVLLISLSRERAASTPFKIRSTFDSLNTAQETLKIERRLEALTSLGPRTSSAIQKYHWAAKFADESGLVVWTLANFSWLAFVLNWVAHVRAANISHFFVGCLDDKLLLELRKRSIPSGYLMSQLGEEELRWGSSQFKKRGREKITFIRDMLEAGLQPLFTDLDVVWLKTPEPWVKEHGAADILISLDLLGPTTFDGSLEPCPHVLQGDASLMGLQNVGIHLMRRGALPVVQAWLDGMEAGDAMEQVVFNRVISSDMRRSPLPSQKNYCRVFGGKVSLGLLPPANFANGHLYFIQHSDEWPENQRPGTIAVHATYILGKITKMHYFRERRLWKADEQDRFQPPGGFVSFDMNIPEGMVANAGPPVLPPGQVISAAQANGHIALMSYQLSQLVVPMLWCGLDQAWKHAHNGRLGHTRLYPLPFRCPLAHAVDLEMWHSLAQHGVLPQFHEEAILQHALMANKSVLMIMSHRGNTSSAKLRLAAGSAAADCKLGVEPSIGCRVYIAGGMSADRLNAVLSPYKNISVLHFTNLDFSWENGPDHNHIKRAIVDLALSWCCAENNTKIPVHF